MADHSRSQQTDGPAVCVPAGYRGLHCAGGYRQSNIMQYMGYVMQDIRMQVWYNRTGTTGLHERNRHIP